MKPKNCIYPDCLNCTLDDCLYNTLEQPDIVQQNKLDKEIAFRNKLEQLEPKQRAKAIYDRMYEQSEKGKARRRRYNQSEEHKISQKKYFQTEKAKLPRKGISNQKKAKLHKKEEKLKGLKPVKMPYTVKDIGRKRKERLC